MKDREGGRVCKALGRRGREEGRERGKLGRREGGGGKQKEGKRERTKD